MQRDFSVIVDCYARLDKAGDPLAKLTNFIDWNSLLPLLSGISFVSGPQGGRPALPPIVMVKCILLQSLYSLSDNACEYQINDRLSFKRFVGLEVEQKSPDSNTIWLYRERMKFQELDNKIFDWFENQINQAGYAAQKGQIVDASFVRAHKPTGKHKKQFEEEIPLTKSQHSQIDHDATFTKKNKTTYYGYKNHIQIDNKHKFIRKSTITTASTHDSQRFTNLLDEEKNTDDDVWADSAYRSKEAEAMIIEKKLKSHVHERAYRNTPLSEEQQKNNTIKSKTRARVEHVFGHMTTSMGGLMVHTIGLARAKVKVTFKNIAYNMQRFAFFENRKTQNRCA